MTNKNIGDSEFLYDLDLNEDDLNDDAKRIFPFHREIFESLNYCGRSVLTNNFLSSGGKHIIRSTLMRSHETVTKVLNYLAMETLKTKPKISDGQMIVICGLPRTGTTLLHNLMACDPSCRAPFLTDMTMQPIPPILRSNLDEHKKRAETTANIEAKVFEIAKCDIKKYEKDFASSHALFPTEEDTVLFDDVGVICGFMMIAPIETNLYAWYINPQNKDFGYKYHQTVLQMLHDIDPPRTHWLLKSPLHTLFIDTLLKYYPQTSIIMVHRRLNEVIPSLYRFFCYLSIFFNTEDITTMKIILKERILAFADVSIDRIIQFRSQEPSPKNVFDIQYEDLIKDPIGTVRRIYEHFNFLKWSDEFEEAMRIWLIDNPQGKQGRHSYSLDDFNLETQLYKDYEKLFLST